MTRPGFEPTISRTRDQCSTDSATAPGPSVKYTQKTHQKTILDLTEITEHYYFAQACTIITLMYIYPWFAFVTCTVHIMRPPTCHLCPAFTHYIPSSLCKTSFSANAHPYLLRHGLRADNPACHGNKMLFFPHMLPQFFSPRVAMTHYL